MAVYLELKRWGFASLLMITVCALFVIIMSSERDPHPKLVLVLEMISPVVQTKRLAYITTCIIINNATVTDAKHLYSIYEKAIYSLARRSVPTVASFFFATVVHLIWQKLTELAYHYYITM
jgi:hypothetical protein